ncbi:MAG TPA: hypothetical protein VHU23_00575 [Rhizomicrobium sp.]|jgi:hypothetical protein|nr:hypothetical protein [Rhizomicrobium sp.]
MADRVEEFLKQAVTARQRAADATGEFRGQWLRVAEMWEMLAKEYQRLRQLRPADG